MAVCLFLLWLLLSLAGNGLVVGHLAGTLEAKFTARPFEESEPFDHVIVLGGGTKVGANGQPECSHSGDRVVRAATLYHAGLTKRIICTGTSIDGLARVQSSPGDESRAILKRLGVPDEQLMMAKGRNTSEEMQTLARLLKPGERQCRDYICLASWTSDSACRNTRPRACADCRRFLLGACRPTASRRCLDLRVYSVGRQSDARSSGGQRVSGGLVRTLTQIVCASILSRGLGTKRILLCRAHVAEDDSQFIQCQQRDHHEKHAHRIRRCHHHRNDGDHQN